MSDFKQQVEQYLKHDRTLVGGKNLYNKLPQKNKALQNAFARFPNTKQNIDKLCYELAKAVDMPERILKMHTQNPVVHIDNIDVVETVKKPDPLTPEDLLLKFNADTTVYASAKTLLKELKIKTANKKKPTIYAALTAARATLVSKKLNELPQEVKASIKLRDQFPFLREPNCPDVLKLLVNDLITAYEVFKTKQPKLHELLGEAESKAIATTVKDNYIANKKAYDELEHYNTKQQILGAHPLFKRLELKDEITAMDVPTLTKKINALTVNVSRNKNKPELLERDEDLLTHAKEVLGKK